MEKGKTIVVFFSHAGENYAVGNIKVGNTKIVADYITELTGAEQFEIKTDKYDGMAYTPLTELAKEEQRKGELPPYEGDIDLTGYDVVFNLVGNLSASHVHVLQEARKGLEGQDRHSFHDPRRIRPRPLCGGCKEGLPWCRSPEGLQHLRP